MNIEKSIKKEIRENLAKEEPLIWLLIYDFTEVRKNSSKVRKFYRKLEEIDSGSRRTDSEIEFQNFEDALRAKELAMNCGAEATLYAGIEL